MRRRNGPVQQWVDSIPSPTKPNLAVSNLTQLKTIEKPNTATSPTEPKDIPLPMGTKYPTMTVSAPVNVPGSPGMNPAGLPSSLPYNRLARDPSLQSDSSHCSSVESLLELRRADPEAILLGLGFGGCPNSPQDNGPLSRIPKRFLQPSKLKGIAINDFVRHQQETSESFDSVSLGYRGLTGSPYVAPSEIVQKIMERLREHESHEVDPYTYNCHESYSPLQYSGTQSVLSPDNRHFLERPRSKSPDMRNKRMIIGQKSFAFGHNGDLIEVEPTKPKDTSVIRSSTKNYDSMEDSKSAGSFEISTNIPQKDQTQSVDSINKCLRQSTFNNNLNVNDAQEESSIKQKSSSDIRRVSEGFCEIKSSEISQVADVRRHSDGSVRGIENNTTESLLLQKRKTLKRQSRISDADAEDYCRTIDVSVEVDEELDSCISHCTMKDLHSTSSVSEDIELLQETKYLGATSSTPLLERSRKPTQRIKDPTISNTVLGGSDQFSMDEDEACCNKEESEINTTQEDGCTNCCCRIEKSKYWKEMKKSIRDKKKLVAKTNRDMSEIREMLGNVLSIRMEPGF